MIEKMHISCRDKSGTDKDHIKRLIEGHFADDLGIHKQDLILSPKIKYYLCLFQIVNAVTQNVCELNFQVINNLMPPTLKDTAPSLFNDCFIKNQDVFFIMEKPVLVFIFAMISTKLAASSVILKEEEYNKELLSMAEKMHNSCRDKSGIDEVHIKRLVEGHFDDDLGMKKYIFCLCRFLNVVTENGELNFEVINNFAPLALKDTTAPLINACFKKNEDQPTLEDKIYKMQECIYKTSPKHHLIF